MPQMPLAQLLKRRWKWLLLIVPVTLFALTEAGIFVYIHFISPDPAPKLSFSNGAAATASSDAGDPALTAAGAIDGTWKVGAGSQVQYRIHETLEGQANEASGQDAAVTGQLAVAGTTVSTASFSVDMKKFETNEDERNHQFHTRIMDTAQFPTATFELTAPIDLTAIPDNLVETTVKATGTLTLHGTTKPVTFDLKARRNGAHIEVNGTIPVTFSDYGIKNPSGGPAKVGNSGDLEFLLIFTK
jgi:polyisoprenoid-binding protein YceI